MSAFIIILFVIFPLVIETADLKKCLNFSCLLYIRITNKFIKGNLYRRLPGKSQMDFD